MAYTVEDLINAAAKLTRTKGRGRPLSGEDAAAWLQTLNFMVEAFALEDMLIYAITKENFTLATSANNYSIGSGGDFNTTRPDKVLSMFIRSSGADHPLSEMTATQYNGLSSKSVSARPSRYFYNPTYPTGTIYFESKPTIGEAVHIDSLKTISDFAALTDTLTLPPGYNALLKFNLAVEGANEYGREVLPSTARRAVQLKEAMKRHNKRIPILGMDLGLVRGRGFNILSGEN